MPRPKKNCPWAEFAQWLDTADPIDLYAEAANSKDVAEAMTICDNIFLRENLDEQLQARTRLLKGRLFVSMQMSKAFDHLEEGLEDAERVLPLSDPEIVEARTLLKSLKPVDPDGNLIDDHWEQLKERWQELEHHMDYDHVKNYVTESAGAGWNTLWYAYSFDAHVKMEGMAGYFANTQGEDRAPTIAAFARLDKELGQTLETAFTTFEKNRAKHDASLVLAGTHKLYEIVPSGEAPGRYDDDEADYEEIEKAYLNQASDVDTKLAQYIRTHPDEFRKIPLPE